ncbi:MAG: YIP1 family protein [Chitinophagaceae bacterium]|nr:YIP1 family protein [Chitinophagaceae bacterium]
MNLIDRARNILLTPKPEWEKINQEKADIPSIIFSYILPLAALAAIAAFIGYSFIGETRGIFKVKSTNLGIYFALRFLLGAVASVFLSAFIIDTLAPTFNAEKNLDKTFQLVAYSYTASLVGGLFAILPAIAIVGLIAGIYGFYLLYLGLPVMKKAPEDKQGAYFVVSVVVIIVSHFVVFYIVERILRAIFGNSMFGFGDVHISM